MSAPVVTISLRHLVAGEWHEGRGPERTDLNPARPADIVAISRDADPALIENALSAAERGARAWASTPAFERGAVLRRAAELLVLQAPRLTFELAREQGKPMDAGAAEIGRAAEVLRWFADEPSRAAGTVLESPRAGERVLTVPAPVGPTLVVTPWNVPVLIPAWKLAPALVHGNTVIWKPSEHAPLVAIRLAEVLQEAGLPAGVLNVVLGDGATAEALLCDGRVRACSFTGSTPVGRHLLSLGARHDVKVLAEMGGKNASIVLADADLDTVVPQLVNSSMLWTGQRCTATSRLLVERSVAEVVQERVAAAAASLVVGDPTEPGTQIGPLSTEPLYRRVLDYLGRAGTSGTVLTGGGPLARPGDGWFVAPTVVGGVDPADPLYMDELFGPVVAAVAFDDFDEALELANRGPYGLSGSVYTGDLDRVLQAVRDFDVGVLHVNSESTGADAHVPFGGWKASGTPDKELGDQARDFYTRRKTVYLRGARA